MSFTIMQILLALDIEVLEIVHLDGWISVQLLTSLHVEIWCDAGESLHRLAIVHATEELN